MTTIIILAGVFAAWRGAAYALQIGGVQRHHVESAWFVLAGITIGAALLRSTTGLAPLPSTRWRSLRANGGPSVGEPGVPRLAWLPLWWVASLALYFPVAPLGLLSDDFVLLAHARRADFFTPDLAFFRPLLLALWWAIDRALPDGWIGVGLHTVSIAVHGTNAFLLTRFAARLGMPGRACVAIGAVFLAFPLSVEAVTWPSAMCDVLLLAELLLAGELLWRAGRSRTTGVAHYAVVAVSLAALGTKETGIMIGPALALLLLVSPQLVTRATIAAVVGACAAAVLYTAARVFGGGVPESHTTIPSGYAIKELLVRPFATLGLPFHETLTRPLAWISAAIAVALAASVTIGATRWHRQARDFRLAAACCLWISLSVLPVFTVFYVSPDLQGSRYLYLGSAFWSLLIYVLARGTLRTDLPASAVCVMLAIGSIAIVREHQQPWRRAAALREAALQGIETVSGACATVQVTGVPDSVDGAFVFRNGFPEAVADRIPRLSTTAEGAPAECRFVWNGSTFINSK